MKTTLELPDDVAALLRHESAVRGGRRKASLSSLLSYSGSPDAPAQVDLKVGRVVVKLDKAMPAVASADVAAALDD